MRRAQDRNAGGLPREEDQVTRQSAGQTGPGTTTGAGATGSTSSGRTTTTTTTVREEQPASAYGRAPQAGYREEPTGFRREYEEERHGGLNTRGTGYGGVFLSLAGLLSFLTGLSIVVRTSFFHALPGYAYGWHVHSWGWLLFGVGVFALAVGMSHLLGIPGTRALGVLMGVLLVVAAFMFLPFTPVTAIIIIALAIVALAGLIHGSHSRGAAKL